jgi:hypothetical protein
MRVLALATIAAVALAAQAEDKKAPEMPSGTWTHKTDELELRFTFKKDELKIVAKTGDATLTVTSKCEIDKDGMIKVTISDVKTKGDFPTEPKEGQEMTFKFSVDGKKAKLSDFKSKDLDHAKAVIEGEYESKSD